MAQLFPAWVNRLPKRIALGGVASIVALALGAWYSFSPEFTDVGYRPRQPIEFSHRLHAGELEVDCRYCHPTAETAAVASLPSTAGCMNCHALVGRDSEALEPLRRSAEDGQPIAWVRVHDLPDYSSFDHSVHLAAGVGCVSCHGDVTRMERLRQVEPLSMRWCLDCHRDPQPELRPVAEVASPHWKRRQSPDWSPADEVGGPEDCSACHS